MPSAGIRDRIQQLLSIGDIATGGSRPWDIHVHDERLYARVMAQGALGLGESYMDGWWDCERLDARPAVTAQNNRWKSSSPSPTQCARQRDVGQTC